MIADDVNLDFSCKNSDSASKNERIDKKSSETLDDEKLLELFYKSDEFNQAFAKYKLKMNHVYKWYVEFG